LDITEICFCVLENRWQPEEAEVEVGGHGRGCRGPNPPITMEELMNT
jgi:hypothetical protein